MKKIIAILMIFILCFGFVGCEQYEGLTEEEFAAEVEKIKNKEHNIKFRTAKIEDDLVEVKDGYFYITGSLLNDGDYDISYFKIVCKFTDKEGNILDSTYTNYNGEIKIGESKKFEIRHKWDERFKKYSLRVQELK